MKIRDLYFPVEIRDPNKKEMREINLFDSSRVIRAVARYTMLTDSDKESIRDHLFYLFGSTWGRFEWEFGIAPDGTKTEPFAPGSKKTCVYDYYVKPNRDTLMALVGSVSKNSARLFLREERKRYGRRV